METFDILKAIDSLIFEQTGKYLDTLQRTILEGTLKGNRYSEIADMYKCTEGHVKDQASELWKILSKILGEDVYKSNFCSTLERLGVVNHSTLIKIGSNFGDIHLNQKDDTQKGINNIEENLEHSLFEELEKAMKLKMIPRLKKLDLNTIDIANSLEIFTQTIEKYLANNKD